MMVAGGIVIGVGIPMTVWGAGRETRPDAMLTVGPGHGELVFRF
jgi:hypothetical protein